MTPNSPAGRVHALRRLGLEALLVGGVGLVLALLANATSPRGLTLTRNYFPEAPKIQAQQPTVTASNLATPSKTTNPPVAATVSTNSSETLAARLQARGLTLVDSNRVFELFNDPGHAQESVLFVDARNDEEYQKGHVPGAYQLDRYYPQNYLPTILPPCLNARWIVVYCNGGNCDDSEFAAVLLHEANIPGERLLVYGGGMAEWAAQGRPTETGARNSGVLKTPSPP